MANTKQCRYCTTDISTKAKRCPQCQGDLRNWFARNPFKTFLLLIFFVIPVIYSTFSDLSSARNEQANSAQDTEQRATETVLGVYTAEDDLGATQINLFNSYEDRTLVTSFESGTEVELLERRIIGDESFNDGQGGYEYCKVRYETYRGWLDCAWLK